MPIPIPVGDWQLAMPVHKAAFLYVMLYATSICLTMTAYVEEQAH